MHRKIQQLQYNETTNCNHIFISSLITYEYDAVTSKIIKIQNQIALYYALRYATFTMKLHF